MNIYIYLKANSKYLSKQQYKTLKGQIASGEYLSVIKAINNARKNSKVNR